MQNNIVDWPEAAQKYSREGGISMSSRNILFVRIVIDI